MEKKNKKTLVIHPMDPSTAFLEVIYEEEDWKVIDDPRVSKKELKEEIKNHDRIIMLGHGTEQGLVDQLSLRAIIDSSLVYLLREKECVCIWCFADQFVKKYRLKGPYTGMIISEAAEALYEGVEYNDSDIFHSNTSFARAVRDSIDQEDFVQSMLDRYDLNSDVCRYNRSNLFNPIKDGSGIKE
jgi:hypothetical protein